MGNVCAGIGAKYDNWIGAPFLTLHILKNRIHVNLDIPSVSSPIRFRGDKPIYLPSNWDFNHDKNALEKMKDEEGYTLEIVDERAYPVFQISYRNDPATHILWVHLRGMLICGNVIYTGVTRNNIVEPGYDTFKLGLPKIFYYPSKGNIGKRAEK